MTECGHVSGRVTECGHVSDRVTECGHVSGLCGPSNNHKFADEMKEVETDHRDLAEYSG